MPLEFLSDAQVAGYGRFGGVPSQADLERFFVLDDADRCWIGDRRGDHNRLGFVLQATTVPYVGRFLEDPLDMPWPVVEYLASQLGIVLRTALDVCAVLMNRPRFFAASLLAAPGGALW